MQIFFNGKKREVTQAYNGKRRTCQCGCAGDCATENENPGKALARIRKIENFIGPMRPDAANEGDAASYSTDPFNGVNYVYVDVGNRTTCVYFKA
jgi:hypothetical protein